jgi:hypothetical protein
LLAPSFTLSSGNLGVQSVAVDLTGYMRILLETYAANDETSLLVVSRFDAACTIPAGLVFVSGL